MRKSIGLYVLKKRISKLKRTVEVNNLDSAKLIGILYDATDPDDEKCIKDFVVELEKKGLKMITLAVFNSKDPADVPPSTEKSRYIGKKDINFYRIPTSGKAKDFMLMKLDILIDCNFKNLFPLRYISSLSKARFKVGPSGNYHHEICDLTIAMKEPVKMDEFISQTKHYLNIINRKQNE